MVDIPNDYMSSTGYGWWNSLTGKGQELATSNKFNYDMQMEAQGFEALEAQKARDYQEYVRQTQYQTAMNDMKAAGINPLNMSGIEPATSSATVAARGHQAHSASSTSSSDPISSLLKAIQIGASIATTGGKSAAAAQALDKKLETSKEIASMSNATKKAIAELSHKDRITAMDLQEKLSGLNRDQKKAIVEFLDNSKFDRLNMKLKSDDSRGRIYYKFDEQGNRQYYKGYRVWD